MLQENEVISCILTVGVVLFVLVNYRSVVRIPRSNLLLSALLTTTRPNQAKTIEALKDAGLRDGVKVMIGGAPTTRAWADEIGADGYAEDAIEAVNAARGLLGVE